MPKPIGVEIRTATKLQPEVVDALRGEALKTQTSPSQSAVAKGRVTQNYATTSIGSYYIKLMATSGNIDFFISNKDNMSKEDWVLAFDTLKGTSNFKDLCNKLAGDSQYIVDDYNATKIAQQ